MTFRANGLGQVIRVSTRYQRVAPFEYESMPADRRVEMEGTNSDRRESPMNSCPSALKSPEFLL